MKIKWGRRVIEGETRSYMTKFRLGNGWNLFITDRCGAFSVSSERINDGLSFESTDYHDTPQAAVDALRIATKELLK